jgi:hypothetical protein
LRLVAIASLALALGIGTVSAEEMKPPRVSSVAVDWGRLSADFQILDEGRPTGATGDQANDAPAAAAEAIARINLATGERFANIAASPVPVLLPFDTPAFMRDREGIVDAPRADAPNYLANYLLGFDSVPFFYAGPGGYDAVVLARPQEMRDLGIGFSRPIYIHISGSALLYELDEPARLIEWPSPKLDDFPGLRRVYLENYARYIFVRYGMPYVLAIECFDGGSRFGKISCRDADKVAIRALKALHFAGGTPQQQVEERGADSIDRPSSHSTVFTYYAPGNIIPGTGFRHTGGVPDYTVYSNIRFPMADAPAFAKSQRFMSWGNCEATGAYAMEKREAEKPDAPGAYRCHGPTRVRDDSASYSYPWRDNFCESRGFYVGQCPGGLGHQGEDLLPATCKQRGLRARCEPYLHEVVAVREAAVLRAANAESLYLVVNAPHERLRFRYLHMGPKQFDAAGLVSGRLVREGEVIGKVGNFFRREGAASTHLHFDLQVPSKYGWVFVNPYMTLVAAYERLIRGRGQEIMEEMGPDIPTGSVQTALPPTGQGAELAAKPTETAVGSASGAKTDSGIPHDEHLGEPSLVTTGMPAAPGMRDGGVQRQGVGARQ